MFAPVGARRASWSRVRVSPPAFSILALAVVVKRRAATDSLGTVRRRLSSVTDPMTTTVFPLWDSVTFEAIRERETGGRLILDINRRRSTTLLKFESVRPVVPKEKISHSKPPRFRKISCSTKEWNSYVRGNGRASREPASRRSRSSAPCDGCRAHGDGPSRYL